MQTAAKGCATRAPGLLGNTLCPPPPSPATHTLQDSPHFANEQRKDAAVEQKIARMQAAAAAMTAAELEAHTTSMDGRLAELEAGRDLTRTWWVLGPGQYSLWMQRCREGGWFGKLKHLPISVLRVDVNMPGRHGAQLQHCHLTGISSAPAARLHVDMDAFFAAVEELAQPRLVRREGYCSSVLTD